MTSKLTYQCCFCCLKVIHSVIILVRSSALETRTTMGGQTHIQIGSTLIDLYHVQLITQVPGGTTTALSPTWTVVTFGAQTFKAWCGITGKTTSTHWDSLRWRSDRSNWESLHSLIHLTSSHLSLSCRHRPIMIIVFVTLNDIDLPYIVDRCARIIYTVSQKICPLTFVHIFANIERF